MCVVLYPFDWFFASTIWRVRRRLTDRSSSSAWISEAYARSASTVPYVWYASADYLLVDELVVGMEVELRCYGIVRSAVGRKTISWELDPGTTVGELLDELETEFSDITPSDLVVMQDRSHLPAEHELADGDVLSISNSPMRE